MRVLYLQFTNPAGYPPLLHSSRILATKGWEVRFLGIRAKGTDGLRVPAHPGIQTRQLDLCPTGWRQKAHYLRFASLALWWGIHWRPDWIYASDPLSCPVALLLSRLPGIRVLYHEHDAPVERALSALVLRARRRLAQEAQLCVLPNQERLKHFQDATGTPRPLLGVWNCAARDDALPVAVKKSEFVLHYHGNIGPDLLPMTLIPALACVPNTRLEVVGYTTNGQESYARAFQMKALRHGLSHRVRFTPAMSRVDLLESTRKASLGLALMPMESPNPNFEFMVGASNKPFDYLACGLPVLVSDRSDWRSTFVERSYGLACDPRSPESIAQAVRWVAEHQGTARLMGELGRQKTLCDWNYESQFQPVFRRLATAAPETSGLRQTY